MEDYQKRVVEEVQSLNEKIQKLIAFIDTETFKLMAPEDSEILTEQLEHMKKYSSVLEERIERFDNLYQVVPAE